MKFRFSWKTTLICGALIIGMTRASVWQWNRHLEKKEYIKQIETRIAEPIQDLNDAIAQYTADPDALAYRRVRITGHYDFSKEMVLRNRRFKDAPGVFVLTPLALAGSDQHIIISRGFIPLSYASAERRSSFHVGDEVTFIALLKESVPRRYLAPRDPTAGPALPWVDAWLRVDLENIRKQLPYPILSVYAERMGDDESAIQKDQLINARSGREEIFDLTSRIAVPEQLTDEQLSLYPIPVFDTVVPPGRHLGYVFEWAGMALITLAIGIILQLRRPKKPIPGEPSQSFVASK